MGRDRRFVFSKYDPWVLARMGGYSLSLSLPPLIRVTEPSQACISVTVTVIVFALHCQSTLDGEILKWLPLDTTWVASRCCAGVGEIPRCLPDTTSTSLFRLTVGELVAVMVLNTVE